MLGNKKKFLAVLTGLALVLGCFTVYGAEETALPSVKVQIESYDRTLMETEAQGKTFLEAVQKAGASAGVDIVLGKDSSKSNEIFSVSGVNNKVFGGNDGWQGFVIRNGNVVQEEQYLDTTLLEGDRVVLYYGDKNITKPLAGLQAVQEGNKITLIASVQYVQWSTVGGKAQPKEVTENLQNLKIHLKTPDGLEQVGMTDKNGRAVFTVNNTGFYTYYAEGYQANGVPIAVKTAVSTSVLGVADRNAMTRGEFAALLVQERKILGDGREIQFSDITGYQNEEEIKMAVSAGYLSGYTDGTFRPDNQITVLEAAVVLSRFYDEEAPSHAIDGVPQWAEKSIALARYKGLFTGISVDYSSPVSVSILETMFHNMK